MQVLVNINFNMPFKCSRHTAIQTFDYKIIHRRLACNEWLKNRKIKSDRTCSFCNNVDSICLFSLIINVSSSFENVGLSVFNTREENHIHESILFEFYLNFQVTVMMPSHTLLSHTQTQTQK